MANPNLTVKLEGTNSVKSINESISWVANDQLEQVITIIDTDSAYDIPIADIANVKVLIFKSATDFNINITTTTPAQTSTMSGTYFVIVPSTEFIANIASITVSTASTTDQQVYLNVYGETAE